MMDAIIMYQHVPAPARPRAILTVLIVRRREYDNVCGVILAEPTRHGPQRKGTRGKIKRW